MSYFIIDESLLVQLQTQKTLDPLNGETPAGIKARKEIAKTRNPTLTSGNNRSTKTRLGRKPQVGPVVKTL